MNDKFLPIGSVVKIKGGEKPVMITSFLIFSNGNEGKNKMFDYGACPFPEGVIDSKFAIGFNHDEIEEVVFLGHVDSDQKKLNTILNDSCDKIREEFERRLKEDN